MQVTKDKERLRSYFKLRRLEEENPVLWVIPHWILDLEWTFLG